MRDLHDHDNVVARDLDALARTELVQQTIAKVKEAAKRAMKLQQTLEKAV